MFHILDSFLICDEKDSMTLFDAQEVRDAASGADDPRM